jgi:membrane associated rhomboid family serine protease
MTWRESWEDGNQGGGAQLSFPRITSAIKILLLINAAVFVVNFFVFLSSESTLTPWLGLSLRTLEERPFLGLMNLITYQFTHSIDVWHILMNSLVLYFFGTMVEREYGPRQLVRLYLLSGIAGGLFWLVFSGINGQAAVPVIGASGSAYGILIYAAFMQPHARVLLLILFVPLWAVAALFGFLALYETLISLRIDTGGDGARRASRRRCLRSALVEGPALAATAALQGAGAREGESARPRAGRAAGDRSPPCQGQGRRHGQPEQERAQDADALFGEAEGLRPLARPAPHSELSPTRLVGAAAARAKLRCLRTLRH